MAKVNQFRDELSTDDGKTVQLNKGHYNLDTNERSEEFNRKMSEGWELEYARYRSDWEALPAKKEVREYPLLVDIELASSCNLKCPMCYTTTDHFKETVSRKLMKWELFTKVVDEIAGKVPAVRLSWRGESTLHKKFVDAVRYAKDKGVKEVSFLTNGWKLELPFFEELVKAGADWITVSFDGVGEDYNRIRAPLKYEETLLKLKNIMEYKRAHGLSKPTIKVQGVWPAIRKNPQLFYSTMKEASDLVAFNPLIDYLGNDADSDIVYEKNFSCPQIYQRVFVSSTGEAMMCNSDEYGQEIIGNALNQTIYEIWHGEKLNRVRTLHARENGFQEVPVCRKCFYPRKMEVAEQAQVDGRTILIENYINRKQQVGT
ncbi:radical SAM protein [bacterium]|nr:radical SAM protein [bacterium]